MISNGTFDYAVKIRRQLHQYPEIGFDLDRTLALVRSELDAMGVPYTEKYGKSSIVATINPDCDGFSIGIRADMDALPIQEDHPELEYASKIPGQMHACGHDAHTAMLLGVAKELKAIENTLRCKVKLLFTPAEEYIQPGCELMVKDGVCDEFDCCIACHVLPSVPVGYVRTIPGGKNANSMGITIEFFGKSAHAADSHAGKDAIAMAVQAYVALDHMSAKEIASKHMHKFHVGAFNGGITNNVVSDYCKLFCTSRAHSDEITQFILDRTRQICEGVAAMNGGTAKVTVNKFLPYVHHDPIMVEKFKETVAKHLGEDKFMPRTRGMGGEDFGFITRVKPSLQFDLGSGIKCAAHHPAFVIDEKCMEVGVDLFTQFVLDHQDGINFEGE